MNTFADHTTPLILNCWYVAALSREVSREIISRRLLGTDVAMYRTLAGEPVAVRNRCPHRSFPLAKGRLTMNREAWSLVPGGVFKLSFPKLGLDSVVVRVLDIDYRPVLWGLTKRGEGANRWFRVLLREGRNRIVRRLFESQNLTVSRLMRVRYGPFVLPPSLKRGKVLEIGEADVQKLLADFGMELGAFAVEILGLGLAGTGTKDACGSLGHLPFPLGNLHRVDFEFLGDLLDGFDALERLKGHAGLEFGVVSSSFAFHFVCVRFGFNAAPTHHNHSLATGLIFWGRLSAFR